MRAELPDPFSEPFRRGWILAADGIPASDDVRRWTRGWTGRRVGRYVLRHDPRTPYHAATRRRRTVHALGLICDVRAPERTDAEVVAGLAAALARGWKRLYQELRYTAGTHVLFLERRGVWMILDATGTVPACHGSVGRETVVASHPRLVAELTGAGESAFARWWHAHPAFRSGGRYLPGLLTPFEGVEIVTPNQRFDVGARTMERFYPDRTRKEMTEEEIVAQVVPALTGQFERLARTHPLVVSLSGGIDSRLTLAATRTIADKATYLTYTSSSRVHRTDLEVARGIVERHGLRHLTFRMAGDPTGGFDHTWELLTSGGRGSGDLTWSLHEHLDPDALHVKSYIVEIIRGFYLKSRFNQKERSEIDGRLLARLFRNTLPDELPPVFDDFIAKTGFTPGAMRGFHYTDVFYWEHLAPAWNGVTIRDHRFAVESYLAFNCRAILEPLLSRPLEDRVRARMVLRLIEAMWPELLDAPVFSGSRYFDLRLGEPVVTEAPAA